MPSAFARHSPFLICLEWQFSLSEGRRLTLVRTLRCDGVASPKICLRSQSGSPGLITDDRLSPRHLVDLLPLQVPVFLFRCDGSLIRVGGRSLGPLHSQKPEGILSTCLLIAPRFIMRWISMHPAIFNRSLTHLLPLKLHRAGVIRCYLKPYR